MTFENNEALATPREIELHGIGWNQGFKRGVGRARAIVNDHYKATNEDGWAYCPDTLDAILAALDEGANDEG